jgi:hypothetical protein
VQAGSGFSSGRIFNSPCVKFIGGRPRCSIGCAIFRPQVQEAGHDPAATMCSNGPDRVKPARPALSQHVPTFDQGSIVRRETILVIWIGGLVLAVTLYLVGPDRFVDACLNLIDTVDTAFRSLVAALGGQAYNAVRSLAIALYFVFVVLAVLASQRGHRSVGALFIVTVVFLALVWRPYDDFPTPINRWIGALVLVVVGAVVMTQRLTIPPHRRDGPPPPYPPGGRSP